MDALEACRLLRGGPAGIKEWNAFRLMGQLVPSLAGIDLKDSLLAGADLRSTDLSGASLAGADLTGADLRGAELGEATLATAIFARADLSALDLRESNLTGCDFRAANLVETTLAQSDLTGAILCQAELVNSVLAQANLSGADLSEANLSGADLFEAILRDADLKNANLSWVVFAGADAERARFDGANLTRARFIRTNLARATFTDAVVQDAQFQDLARLPEPPAVLRLGVMGEYRTLRGHDAESFFMTAAIVEAYLTALLSPREIGVLHFHLGEVHDRDPTRAVFLTAHRHEADGSVLRFQGPNYDAIYAIMPDLLAPFRNAASIDWSETLARLPEGVRADAITSIVRAEAALSSGRWRLAERMADAFSGFRNARVIKFSDGRSKGIRIDVFTNERVAAKLDQGGSVSASVALVVAGDVFNIAGDVTGSAVGRGSMASDIRVG